MNSKIIISTLIGCLLGATVGYSASIITLPHTFTAGTPIKASEVNANFAALAQEIANVKDSIGLERPSNYTEFVISPISAAVGSTVTVGSTAVVIKQIPSIEDPITGKKYSIIYPEKRGYLGGIDVRVSNCRVRSQTAATIVSLGKGIGFTSYVSYSGVWADTSYTEIIIQVGHLCFSGPIEQSSGSTNATASRMINSANELQKYISVKEI